MKFLLEILGMTNQCNLNCAYCDWEREPYFELSNSDLNTVKHNFQNIKKLIDINFPELILIEYSGGEPFVHPDIINVLIDTFNDKWIRINTNGLQIYDEQIENFKNHGKVFIALSLDGVSIKSNYPRFGKNEEKLARIIANLNILIKEKIPIMILCTINQYNILEFPKFVQYLETDYKKEIENGILVLSAHYVTNYNKNNGMPTQSEEQIFLEFLQTSKSLIIEKTKNHYDELGHYVKNKNIVALFQNGCYACIF